MMAMIGVVSLALLVTIAGHSLVTAWQKAKSVTPLDENEHMLAFVRSNPDHHVSTADTEYTKHRS